MASFIKFILLLISLALLSIHSSHAIVMEGRTLKVEVFKDKEGKLHFDVINLKTLKTAKDAAKWCWQLYERNRNNPDNYSNSVHIDFGEGITKEEMQLSCDAFEDKDVYIITATINKDGKKITFEYETDIENSLRLLGIPKDFLKKVDK